MAQIVEHEFGDRAPSVPQVRKLLRDYANAGYTLVVFRRGEQQSEFEKFGMRWHHSGNGLLKAGYKLGSILDKEWFAALTSGSQYKL